MANNRVTVKADAWIKKTRTANTAGKVKKPRGPIYGRSSQVLFIPNFPN